MDAQGELGSAEGGFEAPTTSTSDSLEGEHASQLQLGDKRRHAGDSAENGGDRSAVGDVKQEELEVAGSHESREAEDEASVGRAVEPFSSPVEMIGDVAMLGLCLIGIGVLVSTICSLVPLRREVWSVDRLVGWTMWVPLSRSSMVMVLAGMLPSLYFLRPMVRVLNDFLTRLPLTLIYVAIGVLVLLAIIFGNKTFPEHSEPWLPKWVALLAQAAFVSYLTAFVEAKGEL